MSERVRVAIVGGGPAGLTAAAALAPRVRGAVVVIEREAETGGIPRHSDHLGFGLPDLHRLYRGPAYARRLTAAARDAGARLETGAMVTGWAGERALEVTSPRGRRTIEADAVVLATGARERPRPARLIAGDRPDGIYTTGQLQNLAGLPGRSAGSAIGRRAVVIGAEAVSWSAVLTLRHAGCRTVLMTTEHARSEAHAALRIPGRLLLGVAVRPRTRVVAVNGHGRVASVDVEDLRTGRRFRVPCDTVVTTGDWVPDHELARAAGLAVDPGTRGPRVDAALATGRAGVFAAGNLLHPVDTAGAAALDGRHVAAAVLAHLAGDTPAAPPGVELTCEPPLRWIVPQVVRPGGPAPVRGRLQLWCDELRPVSRLVAVQDGRRIGAVRLPRSAAPGRVLRAPYSLVSGADPAGGPVRVSLVRLFEVG